ncbi:MAG: FMN-binding protein [Clostridia bacterium]
MAAGPNARLLALCSLAVGAIYAAGYVYTEPSAHGVASAASVTGARAAQGPAATASGSSSGASSSPASSSSVHYKDGTFNGNAANAYGTLSVSVTIAGGKISSVQITSYSMHYPQSFIDPQLNQEVVAAQTYNVMLVSGATASSYNFLQAVYNALQSARG